MKILELRFKNLNSLYGEWRIDFTAPEYVSNGIFALTGPTGAGKSTILDAICLALYGATPRLGKITKSGNEIMSRQSGECYAEVVFESQAGRFRCHWEQRRARKSATGSLQDQEHQIMATEASKLQGDIDTFKPEREKLRQALSAASLDGTYATLTAIRKQQADDRNALRTEEELKTKTPIIQKVRSLDQMIAEQTKALSDGTEVCDKEAANATARQNLTESEKLEATRYNDKKAAEITLAEVKGSLERLEIDFTGLKQAVVGKLHPLGISEIPKTQISALLASLKTRLNAWQVQAHKKAETEKLITAFDSEIKR